MATRVDLDAADESSQEAVEPRRTQPQPEIKAQVVVLPVASEQVDGSMTDHQDIEAELVLEPGQTYTPQQPVRSVRCKGDLKSWQSRPPARVIGATISSAKEPALDIKGARVDFVNCNIHSRWEAPSAAKELTMLPSASVGHINGSAVKFDHCQINQFCHHPARQNCLLQLEGDSVVEVVDSDLQLHHGSTQCCLVVVHANSAKGRCVMRNNKVLLAAVGGNKIYCYRGTGGVGQIVQLVGNQIELNNQNDTIRSSEFYHVGCDSSTGAKVLSSHNVITALSDLRGTPYWGGHLTLSDLGNSKGSICSCQDLIWGIDEKPGLTVVGGNRRANDSQVRLITDNDSVEPDDRMISISSKLDRPISLKLPRINRATHTLEVTNDSQVSHVIHRSGIDTLAGKESYSISPGGKVILVSSLAGNTWLIQGA